MNVVAHNLSAMNAQRQFGINTGKRTKSAEKLSSGYKINRAADNAAGLAISEKMRRQIRGLTQGVENTQDGVSLCQVADGALSEVSDMLHRITELSVQAANGTNTQEDRQAIQEEINQILQEIERVSDTTTFNEQLLFNKKGINQTNGLTYNGWSIPIEIKEKAFSFTYILDDAVIFDGKSYGKGDVITGTSLTFGENYFASYDNAYKYDQVVDGFSHSVTVTPNAPYHDQSYPTYEKNGSYSLTLKDLKVDDDGHIYFDSKKYGNRHYLYSVINDITNPEEKSLQAINVGAGTYGAELLVAKRSDTIDFSDDAKKCWIQSGTEAGSGMYVTIDEMNTDVLGIQDLNVTTQSGANRAMEATKGALQQVSSNRARIGAQQNRLEHIIANEENIVENTTAAESRIRDTDMAKEMVVYSNLNILEQVGQAMMAQANQSNQGVLSLL